MAEQPISLLTVPKDNPALINSGYGKISKYIAPRLQQAGFEQWLHCPVGHDQNVMQWRDPATGEQLSIRTGGEGPYGENIIPAHLQHLHAETGKPSMLLFIGDAHGLNQVPQWLAEEQCFGLAWAAIDWEHPTPENIQQRLAPWDGLAPMSRHGASVLNEDGFGNVLDPVWGGVDPDIFHPMDDPLTNTKESMGFETDPDENALNIFSMFANQYQRKGEYEMLKALKVFDEQHPHVDVNFMGLTQVKRDWDLNALVNHLDLGDVVRLSDDYAYVNGEYTDADVARMFAAADCAINLGYEGFGLGTLEAQACGTPVIGFDEGATPEIVQKGIRVPSEKTYMTPAMMERPLPDMSKVVEALEMMWDYKERGEDFPEIKPTPDWHHETFNWDRIAGQLLNHIDTVFTHARIQEHRALGPPNPSDAAQQLANDMLHITRQEGAA